MIPVKDDRTAALERLARDLVYALRAHISDDSRRLGAPVEIVCPCHETVLSQAAALLDARAPEGKP